MKKTLLIVGVVAIAMAACTKKEEASLQEKKVPANTTSLNIVNQFVYTASDNSEVQVTEFKDNQGKECMIVHANYMFDNSVADVSCVASRYTKIAIGAEEKAKITSQVSYKAQDNNIQVTSIRSSFYHDCTITHANYAYDNSKATVDCQP